VANRRVLVRQCGQLKDEPAAILLSLIAQRWLPYVLVTLLFLSCNIAGGPGLAFVVKNFTDSIVSGYLPGVVRAAQIAVVIALVRGLTASSGNYLLNRTSERLAADLRNQILAVTVRAPMAYLDTRESGDIVSCLVNDVERSKEALLEFQHLLEDVFLVAASLVTVFVWSWPAGLCLLGLAVSFALCGTIFSRPVKKTSDLYQENLSRMTGVGTAIFTGLPVAKSLEAERLLLDRFRSVSRTQYETGKLRARLLGAAQTANSLGPATVASVLFAAAGAATLAGKVTVGQAVGIVQLALPVVWRFSYLGFRWTVLQKSMAALGRIREALGVPQEQYGEYPGQEALPPCAFGISFEDVHFRYPGREPVFSGANLEVKPGSRIALVGPSGCGKSTFLKLLLRFYDPESGAIKIAGRDTRKIPQPVVRHAMAVVTQEPYIFPGTARDNIAMAKPQAGEDEIVLAARRAGAHDFVSELPRGYDSVLEERGKNLSRGQKQRICLARAFLKGAPVLVLDEPTSALDAESERLIWRSIEASGRSATTIIISHSAQVTEHVDAVIEISGGRFVISKLVPLSEDIGHTDR